MQLRTWIFITSTLITLGVAAQTKTLAFSQIQSRVNVSEWSKAEYIGCRTARFSPTEIDLNIDKTYHLNIISKTDLPDKGAIYLCKDEKDNVVTVMLFNEMKMYLYSQKKRFLINFNSVSGQGYMADAN